MNENHLVDSSRTLFNSEEVKQRMHEILHENLHHQTYETNRCTMIVKTLSNSIKDALKTFGYQRYKFVVHIHLCDEQNESIQIACRSYWDVETDRFAQSIYMNSSLICVATAFAVFYY